MADGGSGSATAMVVVGRRKSLTSAVKQTRPGGSVSGTMVLLLSSDGWFR